MCEPINIRRVRKLSDKFPASFPSILESMATYVGFYLKSVVVCPHSTGIDFMQSKVEFFLCVCEMKTRKDTKEEKCETVKD